jgi:hypothetical protein
MNVASRELCEELFKLSGWGNEVGAQLPHWQDPYNRRAEYEYYRYDLGYLLRKLPALNEAQQQYLLMEASPIGYAFGYAEWGELRGATGTADTPEDAAAKLCITLINQGVLPTSKEGGEK